MTDTTSIGLIKPAILGDEDEWGQHTNANWDLLDELIAELKSNSGGNPVAETAGDLNPPRHLSNLIGKTSAVICIIGDSTATAGPDQVGAVGGAVTANGVDPSQMLWAGLCDKLRTDNPQISSWTFLNFAIGGTNENAPVLPGSALGVPLPDWFTDQSRIWLSYVQAAQPDVLFYLFGTNASGAGTPPAGAGSSTFITNNLAAIDAWSYVPNVVIVTSKTSTPADTTAGPDDPNSSSHLGQAAFHRYFARSRAAGYTAFPRCQAKGFGLVDLGRYAAARLYGYDPAVQYMRAVPSAIVAGKPLVFGDTGAANAGTIGKSTHGDFRLTFVLRGQGGTILSGYGFAAIRVGMSNFDGNYVRITVEPGGLGILRARYTVDGATAAPPMQSGTLVPTTTGQDVVITVSASGPHIRTWINGVLSLDILGARFVTPVYGGCPINVNASSAPVGAPTFDVTEFFEGIGAPALITTDYDSAFGTHLVGSGNTPGFQGGNSINHQTSLSAAYDRRVIDALDFRVNGGVVNSVAGKTGDVTLVHNDISDWSTATSGFYLAANPANYQTDLQVAATVSTATASYVPLAQRGALNGVATLDGTGVVPAAQLPGAVTGSLTYLGGWNASTNTPTLASGALSGGVLQTAGRYYLVSVTGTTSIDGVATWTAGDWISSNGTIWQRVQNSTSPYLPLTGGTLTGPVTLSGDTWQNAIEPDIPWSLRGAGGNIPVMLDQAGVFNVASLVTPSAVITSLTGVTSLTGLATLGATNGTFTTATIANETISDQTMPDLIGTVAGSNGNVVSGYDSKTGEFNAVSVNAGALKISGTPLSLGTPVPSDALDTRAAPYNAVGDGQSAHGYVTTSGGNTLTITNFTGTLTLAVVDANTSTLTISSARWSGWAFQPRHVGKRLYLVAGAYTLIATVKAQLSGTVVTLDNTGTTITPQTSVSGSITCPAIDTTASVTNKVLIIEGMGQDIWWQRTPSVVKMRDTVTPYGTQTWFGAVAGFPAPNQITISGSFPFTWTAIPTRILWGTNDSQAAINCATDAWPTKRRIWFSGDGRLYLLPSVVGSSAARWTYLTAATGNSGFLFNGVIWGGDNSAAYALTSGAERMPHRVSQASAPRYNDIPKLVHGRQSFPRCAQIPANQPINVLIDGDSLSAMDPQSQVGLVMGAPRFVAEFIKQNPGRQINFYNIGVGGATWASIANPAAAYTPTSGNPYKYFIIPKPIASTVTHYAFWSNINQTGVGPAIIPDVVVMFCNAANDKISYDGLAMQSIINQIRNVSHPDAYGPTDFVMQTDHLIPVLTYGDGPAGGSLLPGAASAMLQAFYNTTMNRTAARNMGFPLIDYAPLIQRAAFAYDPSRRAMRQVPQTTVSPTPTVPVSLAEECLDFSCWIGMTGASDAAAWTAVQQIDIQISPNPGNRLFLRMGPNGHIWMACASYGLAVNTAVTIANGGTTIALGAAPSFAANVTVNGGWPQAYCTDGTVAFTSGMKDQCVAWRTGNYGNASTKYMWQRNYVRTVNDATSILLHEVTHDFSDVVLDTTTSFTIGGQQFIPQDAQGQPDVVIFYADGSIFQTRVAYGSTITPTTATLVDSAPQALSGATVSLFVGRMGLKWFDTGLIPSATTNTGIVALNVIGGEVLLGYLQDLATAIPQYSVFRTVERFGGNFNPVIYTMAAQTITLTNRWVDDDIPMAASAPAWFQRGYIDQNSDYENGGTGGHYGSMMKATVLDTVYSNQNLTV